MTKLMKTSFYSVAGLMLIGLNTVNAIDLKKTQGSTTGDNGTNGAFIDTLNNMLGYLVGLLYFVAVVFALYGGFQILTAGGDEEKVKSGKTTLVNAVIGLVVIFLASIIVNWIISLASTTIK
ncbi:MAG: pilin [Candidatus Gracilibacteria bacterium]|nr:pilin [Candidatus Gracilibacteria bacterium]